MHYCPYIFLSYLNHIAAWREFRQSFVVLSEYELSFVGTVADGDGDGKDACGVGERAAIVGSKGHETVEQTVARQLIGNRDLSHNAAVEDTTTASPSTYALIRTREGA